MSTPLQNRVLPTGEIIAHPARGTLMGNRGGRFHTPDRTLMNSRWKSKQWIFCTLCFKSRHRRVMGQSYTELFFLDTPTALAAGHRPCFECQRAQALEYANAFPGSGRTPAPEMDAILHKERRDTRTQSTFTELPDGAIVKADEVLLKWRGKALVWSISGYTRSVVPPSGRVALLTPKSTCRALASGYVPKLHESAKALF